MTCSGVGVRMARFDEQSLQCTNWARLAQYDKQSLPQEPKWLNILQKIRSVKFLNWKYSVLDKPSKLFGNLDVQNLYVHRWLNFREWAEMARYNEQSSLIATAPVFEWELESLIMTSGVCHEHKLSKTWSVWLEEFAQYENEMPCSVW